MKKKLLLTTFLIITILIILSFRVFEFLNPFLPYINYLLGKNSPTTYLFLLGNDTEARANGGFAGSYAKAVIARSETTKQSPRRGLLQNSVLHNDDISISFHDIYVPNGQLDGYVKPPDPIQQAFGHGTWELANADWDPNFPTTATTIRWFLEKGKEVNPNILGLINLSTIKKIFNLIGTVTVSEYNATITPDNLYLFLQGKAELNFFPGSTQKADALHAVGTATFKKIKSLSLSKKYQITKIIYTDLKNQNIVLNSTNSNFQNFLISQKFAGEYQPSSFDHFGLVEVNLGANKANAYVTRHTTHIISVIPDSLATKQNPSPSLRGGTPTWQSIQVKHQVNIQFQNSSPEANPNPPLQYGGHYIAFLRLYLPQNATDINISHTEVATTSAGFSPDVLINQTPVIASQPLAPDLDPGDSAATYANTSNQKFKIVNFWHLTLAGNTSEINLSYSLPNRHCEADFGSAAAIHPLPNTICDYSLTLLKQNGFPSSPQTLNFFGQTLSTSLESSFTYPTPK